MTCFFIAIADQGNAQPGPGGVSVGFNNASHTAVVVKGYTIVQGMQRPGQLLPMKKNGKAFEPNVPTGIRFYTIYDPITQRPLLKDHPVPIRDRDVFINIITSPLDPQRVVIVVLPQQP